MEQKASLKALSLPGLDCGACGSRTCEQFAQQLEKSPGDAKLCIHLGAAKAVEAGGAQAGGAQWKDSLGREYDFILETFKGDPGPRETLLPHNPMLTRELDIKVGDILVGRPMGMSCGCPITHCGVAMEVDAKTGVIVWCVTGPLQPRSSGYKDLGYYTALAYEGIVRESRAPLKIGVRYWFMPRRCMLQWRHSGMVNFMNRAGDSTVIRIEGLYIG